MKDETIDTQEYKDAGRLLIQLSKIDITHVIDIKTIPDSDFILHSKINHYHFKGSARNISKLAAWCSSKKIRPFQRIKTGGHMHYIKIDKESLDKFLRSQKGAFIAMKIGII